MLAYEPEAAALYCRFKKNANYFQCERRKQSFEEEEDVGV